MTKTEIYSTEVSTFLRYQISWKSFRRFLSRYLSKDTRDQTGSLSDVCMSKHKVCLYHYCFYSYARHSKQNCFIPRYVTWATKEPPPRYINQEVNKSGSVLSAQSCINRCASCLSTIPPQGIALQICYLIWWHIVVSYHVNNLTVWAYVPGLLSSPHCTLLRNLRIMDIQACSSQLKYRVRINYRRILQNHIFAN